MNNILLYLTFTVPSLLFKQLYFLSFSFFLSFLYPFLYLSHSSLRRCRRRHRLVHRRCSTSRIDRRRRLIHRWWSMFSFGQRRCCRHHLVHRRCSMSRISRKGCSRQRLVLRRDLAVPTRAWGRRGSSFLILGLFLFLIMCLFRWGLPMMIPGSVPKMILPKLVGEHGGRGGTWGFFFRVQQNGRFV